MRLLAGSRSWWWLTAGFAALAVGRGVDVEVVSARGEAVKEGLGDDTVEEQNQSLGTRRDGANRPPGNHHQEPNPT
jgi:hypothetical protein